jgi:hypothetical protein
MGYGLQRAANAASESRRRTTGKPGKPWRVYGVNNLSEDYRSEKGAYEAVRELSGFGHPATVWHWEEGGWRLYDQVDPPAPSAEKEGDR